FRNLIRSPRRSVLTGLGIAAAIAALVAFVGLIDSFLGTIERAETEIVADEPDRLEVELFNFYPVDSRAVGAIAAMNMSGSRSPRRASMLSPLPVPNRSTSSSM